MKFIKSSITFLFLILVYVPVLAQVDTVWVRSYNGSGNGNDRALALTLDDSGNVYVTGRSLGTVGLDDFCTIKYNSIGDTLWVRSYNGIGNDIDVATSIAVDNGGNVYVTGYTWNGSSDDYTTIKYFPTGDTQWVRNYNGPGNGIDQANALTIDDSGNVYVTGTSRGSGVSNRDFATIKYSPLGDTLWVRRFDSPSPGNDDAGLIIALDSNKNVYVSGYIREGGVGRDYATIKYSPVGDTLWTRRYNGPGNGNDLATASKADNMGNVYITGYSTGVGTGFDFATVKRNSLGDTLWVRRYNGPGFGDDSAKAIVVDTSGSVYVTGSSVGSGTGYDYTTIKYNSIGDTLWLRRFNGAGNGADLAQSLALDNLGNVYVTGYSWNGSSYDYLTIKYNSNGDTVWTKSYNGTGNGEDVALAVLVDKFINVYVSGYCWNGTSYDYVTVKYIQNRAPILDSVGAKNVAEGSNLTFRIHSSDVDGDSIILTAVNLPANATFFDSGNGAGSFSFNPNFSQAGLYPVIFKSTDGVVSDSEIVNINVTNLCLAKSGDLNADNNIFLPDIVLLVSFLYRGGPAPSPLCTGDANADGNVNLADVIYLTNFIFKSGPAPLNSLECCL